MENKFKKLGKTELFVRTITEFKRNILNDTILSLQCILESINRINTDSTITIESITSGEDSYITNYNHYLFTSLRVLDKYSGITANDIHYAIQLQDCIMKGENQRLVLTDESEEKERYTSFMCFKTEEELAEYKKKGYNEIITLFHDAKRVQEYL